MKLTGCGLLLSASTLSACTVPNAEPTIPERGVTPGYRCQSNAMEPFVGKTVSQDIGRVILEQSSARSVRWIAPGSAVTMDYREDRVNIAYDGDRRIVRIYCG